MQLTLLAIKLLNLQTLMRIYLEKSGRHYRADLTAPIDISLPLKTGQDTVNCYYADEVTYSTIAVGDFVGSTLQGGSCNYQRISLTPHGNGTHTECYGHISTDGATIHECHKDFFSLALLITVPLLTLPNGDQLITLESIEKNVLYKRPEALIIRTLPNDDTKKTRHYSGTNPPYLEASIGTYLADKGIKHLLLDLPSVDKEWDEGALSAHRNFWGLPPRHQPIDEKEIRKDCTITELIYVPDNVADGLYLLNLQIASFLSDASPSKPVLYQLWEEEVKEIINYFGAIV